ncbi:hypothetical protein WKK05_22910 [Nostoc sp. UHCC 0302]
MSIECGSIAATILYQLQSKIVYSLAIGFTTALWAIAANWQ